MRHTAVVVEAGETLSPPISEVLQSAGWRTLVASDLFAARHLLQSIVPRLVVVSLSAMPHAAALVRWIREHSSDALRAVAVLVTGRTGEAVEGASEVVVEPWRPSDLLAAVGRIVSGGQDTETASG